MSVGSDMLTEVGQRLLVPTYRRVRRLGLPLVFAGAPYEGIGPRYVRGFERAGRAASRTLEPDRLAILEALPAARLVTSRRVGADVVPQNLPEGRLGDGVTGPESMWTRDGKLRGEDDHHGDSGPG